MTRAESPLTELDAALDQLEQLNRNLARNIAVNALTDHKHKRPTTPIRKQIARQREIVRRIARGEQE